MSFIHETLSLPVARLLMPARVEFLCGAQGSIWVGSFLGTPFWVVKGDQEESHHFGGSPKNAKPLYIFLETPIQSGRRLS